MILKKTLSSTGQAGKHLRAIFWLYSATTVCVGLLVGSGAAIAEPQIIGCSDTLLGESFEIVETDLLEHILSRLRALRGSEKFEEIKLKTQKRVREMTMYPRAIEGIYRSQIRKEYSFDPTVTVTRDLSDHNGKIFARKGDRINPLNNISMKPLLFIDGDDADQVKWALSKINDKKIQRHEFGKIILIKGSPLDLRRNLGREIYFDQFGILTKKLGIKHVPAMVFQKPKEKTLTIIEDVL